MITSLSHEPNQVMSKNGKSFYFASIFFDKKRMQKISRLYQLCRYVDDCADELEPEISKATIQQLRLEIENPKMVSEFQNAISQVCSWGVKRQDLLQLLNGAEFDQSQVRIRTQAEFLQYCYWVAGVVGHMMFPLLGCKDNKALQYARDLGIAMQITNICRDVLEDVQKDRVYLAEEILQRCGVRDVPKQPSVTPPELREVVRLYLKLADDFYESGYKGLSYIPLRSRICIVLAGEIYRGIGAKIASRQFDVLAQRVYLTWTEKLVVAFKSIRFFGRREFWFKMDHPSIFILREDQ